MNMCENERFTIFMGCVRTMPCRRIRFWWLSECMAFTSLMKSSRPSESNTLAFRHFTATDNWKNIGGRIKDVFGCVEA